MNGWPRGFLAPLYDSAVGGKEVSAEEAVIIGQYIATLHQVLWRFVRAASPSASGELGDYIEELR